MKKTLLLSAALLSAVVANADTQWLTVHMNLELINQVEESTRTIESDVVLNLDEVTRIATDDLFVDVSGQILENSEIELDFVVSGKNQDETWEVQAQPTIKTRLDQEATLHVENDTESLELTVIAHQE